MEDHRSRITLPPIIAQAVERKDGTLAGELLFWAGSAEFLVDAIAEARTPEAALELASKFADCLSRDLRALAARARDGDHE